MNTKKLISALALASLAAGALLLPGVSAAHEGRFGPSEPPRVERHHYPHHNYRAHQHYRHYRDHFYADRHHRRNHWDGRGFDHRRYRDDVRIHIDYDVHL